MIHLWNPETNKFEEVTEVSSPFQFAECRVVMAGVDAKNIYICYRCDLENCMHAVEQFREALNQTAC